MNTRSMFNKPAKLLAVGGLLFAALLASQAAVAASIIASKHDLTSSGTNSVYTATVGAEPCAFCHTPHGASNSAQLWNRGPSATASFTLYSSSTMNGSAVQPGANSILCLSCHDGATALDLIINKPGTGGQNAGGLSAGYTFLGGNTTGNLLKGGIASNLSTTLADDHPVGIPYCGATAAACLDTDFRTTNLYLNTTVTGINVTAATGTGWWLDTGAFSGGIAGATRTKQDLPLYQGVGNQVPRVECATCHEPHDNANGTFLRIANTGSQMCVTCHLK